MNRQELWHSARVPDPAPRTLSAPTAKPKAPQTGGSGVAVAMVVEVVVSIKISVDVMRSVRIAVFVLVVR